MDGGWKISFVEAEGEVGVVKKANFPYDSRKIYAIYDNQSEFFRVKRFTPSLISRHYEINGAIYNYKKQLANIISVTNPRI